MFWRMYLQDIIIAMDVAWYLTSATPLTARRETSSCCVKTSFAVGLPNLAARPSPPHMCLTATKSTQVAPWLQGRTNWKGPIRRTREIWRVISSSETSGHRRRTVFTTCMLWILTPLPTSPKSLIISWKPLRRRRGRRTSTPASNSVSNSLLLSYQLTAFAGLRRRQHLNISPDTLQWSGMNPTHLPAGTWRLGLRSLSPRQINAVSGGQGFRPIKPAWNYPSGRTARA